MSKPKLFNNQPIFISSQSQIDTLKQTHRRTQTIEYKCYKCGKLYQKQLKRITTIDACLCKECWYYNVGHLDSERQKAKLQKMKETCLLRYGETHFLKTKLGKQKALQARLNKFGAYNPPNQGRSKIVYNNVSFDSTWELCFYVYCVDHNIVVSPHPKVALPYTAEDGRIHFYEPDFLINNKEYVEIKGNQFFGKDGYMFCPYDKTKSERYRHKHVAMLRYNVSIIKTEDIGKYINYILKNYSDDFIKKYNITKPHI